MRRELRTYIVRFKSTVHMVINIGRRKPRSHQGRIHTAVLYSCITLSSHSVLSTQYQLLAAYLLERRSKRGRQLHHCGRTRHIRRERGSPTARLFVFICLVFKGLLLQLPHKSSELLDVLCSEAEFLCGKCRETYTMVRGQVRTRGLQVRW